MERRFCGFGLLVFFLVGCFFFGVLFASGVFCLFLFVFFCLFCFLNFQGSERM